MKPVVAMTLSAVRFGLTLLALALIIVTSEADAGLGAPPNDDCANATVVSMLPFAGSVADTSGATTDPSDPTLECVSLKGSHTIWYRFTAPGDGVVVADTAGSSHDTLLAAHTGACGALTEIACNDDGPSGVQSQVSFQVVSGTTYFVEVADNGEGGAVELALAFAAPPSNDACSAPIVIATAPFDDTLDTIGATTVAADPVSTCGMQAHSASVWYRFTPGASGTVTVDTFGSSYDTVVTAWVGGCDALSQVSCNDDDDAEPPHSRLEFAATGGTAYLLEVSGFGTTGGGDLALTLGFATGATPGGTATPTPTLTASPTPTRTATPTALPSATVTIVATATATASTTPTATTTGPTATPGIPTTTPTAAITPDPAAAKTIEKCQKAIVAGTRTFAAKKAKSLATCVNAAQKCIQTIADDVKRAACVVAAGAKCTAAIAKIGGAAEKLRAGIVAKCAVVAAIHVAGPHGLDFDRLAPGCADPTTAAGIAACVAERAACEVDRLFVAAAPRTAELLELVGVPPAARATLACLPAFGGTGADLDLEATFGKTVAKCQAAAAKASAALVRGEYAALAACATRAFTCAGTKRADAACPAKATAGCTKDLAKIAGVRVKAGAAIAKACGAAAAIDFAVLRDPAAVFLDALAPECAAAGVPSLGTLDDYTACLTRQHACRTVTVLGLAMPRARSLIDALPLMPPFAFPAACPAP